MSTHRFEEDSTKGIYTSPGYYAVHFDAQIFFVTEILPMPKVSLYLVFAGFIDTSEFGWFKVNSIQN